MRAARRAVSADDRARWSGAVAAHLTALQVWREASTVGLFLSLPDELDTEPLVRAALAAGKRVAVPLVTGRGEPLAFCAPFEQEPSALAPGAFGVREPTALAPRLPLQALDLVVLPGLAFDARGGRLGYGGGYYDRTLARLRCPTVMVAFGLQAVDVVPVDAHDRPVPMVITEDGLHRAPGV